MNTRVDSDDTEIKIVGKSGQKSLKQSPIDIEDGGAMEAWAKDFVVSRAALQYRICNL
jgi:hypothetical protein